MARKKTQQGIKILKLARKNTKQLFLGALIVATVLIGISKVVHRTATLTQDLVPAISIGPSEIPAYLSPTKTSEQVTSTTQTENNSYKKPVIKKLPFTASEPVSYTLKEGDSLAKLGSVFCNDKRAWMYLEQLNNLNEPYMLHPGDIITISCPSSAESLACEK